MPKHLVSASCVNIAAKQSHNKATRSGLGSHTEPLKAREFGFRAELASDISMLQRSRESEVPSQAATLAETRFIFE